MLKERDLDIPVVAGGSVITDEDAHKLREMGAADAFCPSTTDKIIESIRRIARRKIKTQWMKMCARQVLLTT